MSIPAHHTKHLSHLTHSFSSSTFSLTQVNDGRTNGTALWLGGQCLAWYLASFGPRLKSNQTGMPPNAIELGSGIGLTALALASLGWNVIATDIPDVISSVLDKNIRNNRAQLSGTVHVRELDWTVPPDKWVWSDGLVIASQFPPSAPLDDEHSLKLPFQLIFSADTVYKEALIEPLLRTLHGLSMISVIASKSLRGPPILICIERRDPLVVDRLLLEAKQIWNFDVERVSLRKIAKALEKGGVQWEKNEWDSIEIWKMKLRQG